jgi:tRNA(Ile)-lysidine synthase
VSREPVPRTQPPAPLSFAGYAKEAHDAVTPEGLHEQVRAQGLLGERGQVVAMLSGGRDSVCLLDVAVAVRGADNVRALHVNYGLRGRASYEDERYCAELCSRLEVWLELVRVGERERGEGNLQAWARERRYEIARRLAAELDAPVATGHTASDQVETILYRLAASPGRRALLGMSAREGWLVRPLLSITREQTAEYCEARGLRWREDASNDDIQYARVRVRKLLVPALRAVHPAAAQNVRRTAELLREETDLLAGLVAAELGGRDAIALARLGELHPALARLIVVRLAEETAGELVPQAGERVGEILALGARGGAAELHVGGNVGARIADGELRMVRLGRRAAPEEPGDWGSVDWSSGEGRPRGAAGGD